MSASMRGTGFVALVALLAACSDPGATDDKTANASTPGDAASVSLPAPEAGDDDPLRDVLAGSGIDYRHVLVDGKLDSLIESVGLGVLTFDYDGDGQQDIYFVDQGWREGVTDGAAPKNARGNRLYRNLGNMRFADVTEAAGVGDTGYGFMAIAADLDDDGDQDLYVLNDGPNVLYTNDGDGTFTDTTTAAGVGGDACSVGGAVIDADGDGRLDLYVGNYVTFDPSYKLHYSPDVFPGPLAFEPQADVLYVNKGDGTFTDGTKRAGLDIPAARAMGVSVIDANGDGRLDLYVANDATANFLFVAQGDGRFAEVAAQSGVAYGVQGEATAAMAAAVGDVDNDGKADMHVSDSGYGSLFHNAGNGLFVDRVIASGIAAPSGSWASWGGGFLDYDLDGALDLYLANGDLHRATGRPDLLFHGRGDTHFDDESTAAGAWFRAERMGRGAALADLDSDGRMDVVVCHIHDAPALLHGRAPVGRHFVTLDLRAKPGNANSYGARVTVTAGERTHAETHVPRCGYLGQGDPRMLIGLGDATRVDRVEIVWPDGETQTFEGLDADRVYVVPQGSALR